MKTVVEAFNAFDQRGLQFCNMTFIRDINERYSLMLRTDVTRITIHCKLLESRA